MKIREIVDANIRAQELLYSVVNEHGDLSTREIDTVSAYKSICQLLAHIIGAQKRWTARLKFEPAPARYEDLKITDLSTLHADWRAMADEVIAVLERGGDDLLNTTFEIKLPQWNHETTVTGEEIFYILVTHESYHRGQCSFMLQMFGVDPPNFDYVLTKGG